MLGSVQLNFISRVFTTGTIDCADTQSSVRDEWKMCWLALPSYCCDVVTLIYAAHKRPAARECL